MLKRIKLTKNGKIVVIIIGFILLIVMALTIYYHDKFYPHTNIGKIDVSGMTVEEAKKYIKEYVNDYEIELQGRNDGKVVIKGKDISLNVSYEDIVEQCFSKAHQGISFYKVLTNNDYEHVFETSYDQQQLKSIVDASILIAGSDDYQISSPVNAYVEYDSESKSGKVVAEQLGNQLDSDKLYKVLDESLKDLADKVNLDKKAVYVEPAIYQDSDIIDTELATYNQYVLKWIQWDMGEDHLETITPEDIKDWIIIGVDGSVDVNKEKMAEWVEKFCLKYKTVGKTRSFKSHTGAMIEVSGGDYGWQLDYDQTVEDAYNAIKSQTKQSLIDAYLKKQSKANKKALTVSLEPDYKNKGHHMNYEDPEEDWDTSTYTEVDIAAQKVYVFKNGEVVYSAKCVTGLPSDPTRATKTGCWYIKDKKLEYTLVGEDYETPTKYWIRITWTGTGYHYMNRSDWDKWTPELYKTKGSHGCINLQLEDVKTIYGYVKLGDMVFIH